MSRLTDVLNHPSAAQDQFDAIVLKPVQTDTLGPRAIMQREQGPPLAQVFQWHGPTRRTYTHDEVAILDIETGTIGWGLPMSVEFVAERPHFDRLQSARHIADFAFQFRTRPAKPNR